RASHIRMVDRGPGIARSASRSKAGSPHWHELDWIAMKALDKDRNRRYESASAFAADVHRYLNDEPVLACPPSLSYRISKFVRRHKGRVLACLLLILVFFGGLIGTAWGLIRASDARADALRSELQKERAMKDREAALASAQQSERARAERSWWALISQAR